MRVCLYVQSDIIHQSALELIHSEDRESFKSQLDWRSQLTADNADLSVDQLLQPGGMYNLHLLLKICGEMPPLREKVITWLIVSRNRPD